MQQRSVDCPLVYQGLCLPSVLPENVAAEARGALVGLGYEGLLSAYIKARKETRDQGKNCLGRNPWVLGGKTDSYVGSWNAVRL